MENISAENYDVVNGCLAFLPTTDTDATVKLCNFSAEITSEYSVTDGIVKRIFYTIKGTLSDGTPLQTLIVSAENFNSLKWVNDYGSSAIIYPVKSARSHIPVAIKFLSASVSQQIMVAHTGWVASGESHCYLTNGDVIGHNCDVVGFNVSIDDLLLSKIAIHQEISKDKLQEAILNSLLLADLEQKGVMVSLLGATYLAPLGEFFPLDFSVFLYGATGSFKSQLTMLCQSHFGREFHNTLPGNWSSTENALEVMSYVVKDALFVIDDFTFLRNETSSSGFKALEYKAERIFRGHANAAGKQRMSLTGLASNYHSRAMIMTSGETLPTIDSLIARLFIIRLEKGDIASNALRFMQEQAKNGIFEAAMGGYIAWLAENYDYFKQVVPARFNELRADFIDLQCVHARTPENVAKLYIGIEMFAEYAVEMGATTETKKAEMLDYARNAFFEAGMTQRETFHYDDKVQTFLDTLNNALNNGHAHVKFLKPREFQLCTARESFGWVSTEGYLEAKGTCIGWVEGHKLYLLPALTFDCISNVAISKGIKLDTKALTWKKLVERCLVIKRDPGRITTRKRVDGLSHHVLCLDLGKCIPVTMDNIKHVKLVA